MHVCTATGKRLVDELVRLLAEGRAEDLLLSALQHNGPMSEQVHHPLQ